MKAIYERELKSYFDSMTGYVFIAFVTMFIGIYFMANNMIGGYPYFSYTLSALVMILMIAVPVLTMRSMSEERRSRTDQLLLTSPVSLWGIVVGKYLSMVTVFAVPMLVACLCPLVIQASGTAYLAEDYAAILTFFLLGCAYISIGLFISSLTESQLISAAATFGVLLLLILWPELLSFLPTTAQGSAVGLFLLWSLLAFFVCRLTSSLPLAAILEAAGAIALAAVYFFQESLLDRALVRLLENVALADVFDSVVYSHVLDLSGLLYYISVTGVMLFLTVQAIERRRWS